MSAQQTGTGYGRHTGLLRHRPGGGAGTRLWPLSRAAHPKFLLDLTGTGRTLLQQTWDRLAPLTGEAGLLVVTGCRARRRRRRAAARTGAGEPAGRAVAA